MVVVIGSGSSGRSSSRCSGISDAVKKQELRILYTRCRFFHISLLRW